VVTKLSNRYRKPELLNLANQLVQPNDYLLKVRLGKPGKHSRKDGWKESEELSTDLNWAKIANRGLTK